MIALLNPKSAKWKHRIPLSILSLGAALEGRYDYHFIDGNLDRNVGQTLLRTIREKGIRYLGVTVMPGPQLVEAIKLTQLVKAEYPSVTTIWGGYFPSLHQDVVLKSGFVDHVVRGPGDEALVALLDRLEGRTPAPREGGEHKALPYHRFDVEQYLNRTCLGSRTIVYHSSFGCPFVCGFCAVASIYKGRWTGSESGRVVDDVLDLKQRYNINAVEFIDNNFFVAEKRTADVADGLRGKGIAWWGEARPDTLMHYSDATWEKMRDGGCRMLFFGVESSSADMLAAMDKGGTQTPDMVLELARRAKAFDIVPEFSFVLGAPSDDVGGEIERDIRYIRRIKEVNPDSEIIIYMYSPVSFDDAPLFQRASEHGFKFPERLTDWLKPEWIEFDLRKNPQTPWLKPEHIERVMNFERVLNARYPTVSDIKLRAWQIAVLKTLGSWRYRTGFYKAPYEIRFVANRLFKYRQPEIEGF